MVFGYGGKNNTQLGNVRRISHLLLYLPPLGKKSGKTHTQKAGLAGPPSILGGIAIPTSDSISLFIGGIMATWLSSLDRKYSINATIENISQQVFHAFLYAFPR